MTDRLLARFSRLVTARPWITVGALVLVTVLLAAGATRRAAPTEGDSATRLPPGNAVVAAVSEIDELFGDRSDVSIVTLVFRGEALTPSGLSQMDALLDDISSEPDVAALLAPTEPIIAPSSLVRAALAVDDLSLVSRAEIDSIRSAPEIAAALEALTGVDTDGAPVAVATVRLRDPGDERVADAERTISDLAGASQGPLRVSSLSPAVIEDEYSEATRTGMLPLIGVALALIAALILLFLRRFSDLLLTLLGLLLSLIWIIGAEGWLGPNALGWLGAPSSLTTMVPIIVISLAVDYAIQAVSHYRERLAGGDVVGRAVRAGLRNVAVPLTLAALTTVASFLATLFSPISSIRNFGVVAGLGVGLSLIVMLTLVPAGRAIIDRRREARGDFARPRLVSAALPGVGRAARVLGTPRPRPPRDNLPGCHMRV